MHHTTTPLSPGTEQQAPSSQALFQRSANDIPSAKSLQPNATNESANPPPRGQNCLGQSICSLSNSPKGMAQWSDTCSARGSSRTNREEEGQFHRMGPPLTKHSRPAQRPTKPTQENPHMTSAPPPNAGTTLQSRHSTETTRHVVLTEGGGGIYEGQSATRFQKLRKEHLPLSDEAVVLAKQGAIHLVKGKSGKPRHEGLRVGSPALGDESAV